MFSKVNTHRHPPSCCAVHSYRQLCAISRNKFQALCIISTHNAPMQSLRFYFQMLTSDKKTQTPHKWAPNKCWGMQRDPSLDCHGNVSECGCVPVCSFCLCVLLYIENHFELQTFKVKVFLQTEVILACLFYGRNKMWSCG